MAPKPKVNDKAKRPSQHFYVPKARRDETKKNKDTILSQVTVEDRCDVDALASQVQQSLNLEPTQDTDSWDRLYDSGGECTDEKLVRQV
jgi:hypothetical protein